MVLAVATAGAPPAPAREVTSCEHLERREIDRKLKEKAEKGLDRGSYKLYYVN